MELTKDNLRRLNQLVREYTKKWKEKGSWGAFFKLMNLTGEDGDYIFGKDDGEGPRGSN